MLSIGRIRDNKALPSKDMVAVGQIVRADDTLWGNSVLLRDRPQRFAPADDVDSRSGGILGAGGSRDQEGEEQGEQHHPDRVWVRKDRVSWG